ncbi:hypothetical protein [Nonomuraea turkmeniaca]|uniref:hypothetical protein n=1 Tax=Nonomuraea turkmeniaca TaxID=103838 RepID=UPI0014777545|nr:hypothetical protein [Nonomuraea turkmeniaca]
MSRQTVSRSSRPGECAAPGANSSAIRSGSSSAGTSHCPNIVESAAAVANNPALDPK